MAYSYLLSALLLTGLLSVSSLAQEQMPEAAGQLAFSEPPREALKSGLRDKLLANIAAAESFEDRYDAEAWLLLMSGRLARYVPDPGKRLQLLRKVHHNAKQVGLQPELVLAVIEVESHFNPYALSPVGAQGIMQVMPFWKNEIGRPEDNLIDLDTNLQYGCTILKHYLDRSDNRLAEALARYNGSYGSYRYTMKVMDAWDRWR